MTGVLCAVAVPFVVETIEDAKLKTRLLYAVPALATVLGPSPGPMFGMVGLAKGQTTRLRVLNIKPPPPPEPLPDPCGVELGFRDSQGLAILDTAGREVSAVVSLLPGQTATLEMRAADIDLGGRRKQIRAVLTAPPPGGDRACTTAEFVATLEIADSRSGETEVLYPGFGFTEEP